MNSYYPKVALTLCAFWFGTLSLAASTPLFLDCNQDTITLCVSDPGVRLPANNQSNLGEGNPDATSCSVHISRQATVQVSCPGELTYEVVLYLFQSSDPVLLQSTATATPDSQLMVTLSFDSEFSPDSMLRKNGIPYTTGCARYHRVVWTVTDACGESSECEMWMDIYDCAPPVYSTDEFITLYSTIGGLLYFNLNSLEFPTLDDCSLPTEFLYSFSTDEYITQQTFDVCEFEPFGVQQDFEIWIADKGRDLNCDQIIEWHERNITQLTIHIVVIDISQSHCYDLIYIDVGGEISDPKGNPVKDVLVEFNRLPYYFPMNQITKPDGRYLFSNSYMSIPQNPATIKPHKDGDDRNGVTILDMIKMMKYFLGIEGFDEYQMIAGDLNNTGHTSVVDLIELRKLVLGKIDEFSFVDSWTFVPEMMTLNPDTSIYDADFMAIKKGDVNRTADPQFLGLSARNERPVLTMTTHQISYHEGERIKIDLLLKENVTMEGLQFSLHSPDLDFEKITSNTITVLEEDYALFGNNLTIAWMDIMGHNFDTNDIILTIHAKANTSGDLRSSLRVMNDIDAEIILPGEIIMSPSLEFQTPGNEFNFSFTSPNPWKESTSISFRKQKAGMSQVDVFDPNGTLIFTTNQYCIEGDNEFIIHESDITGHGIFIYVVKLNDKVDTGKMLKLR